MAVILTPVQDLILVMSRSLSQGTSAIVVTAAGVGIELMALLYWQTLCVGTLVQTSGGLFLAMKIVGAPPTYFLYLGLLYLGVSLLRVNNRDLLSANSVQRSTDKLFLEGAIPNIANPKSAIFYDAFLPKFVAPGVANPTRSVFLLGAASRC